MNIESPNITKTNEVKPSSQTPQKNEFDTNFAEELNELKNSEAPVNTEENKLGKESPLSAANNSEDIKETTDNKQTIDSKELLTEPKTYNEITPIIQIKMVQDNTEPVEANKTMAAEEQIPLTETVEQNKPSFNPFDKPILEPVEQVVEPIIEPVVQEKPEQPIEPIVELIVQEKPEQPIEPIIEPIVQEKPIPEQPIEPIIEPVVQEKPEQPIEPIVEPIVQEKPIEPILDPVVEPIVQEKPIEPITEPIVQEKPEEEIIDTAIQDLTSVLNKINSKEEKEIPPVPQEQPVPVKVSQKDDKKASLLKNIKDTDDKENEGEDVINNDFNVDNKDKLPQMNLNMSFGGDGQPFSSFMNSESEHNRGEQKLSSSAKDLAEEAAILSTMAENVAMANKSQIETPETKIVHKNDGIKKVDTKTNIVQETIVKYDTVVMNEADVEVFTELVQNGEANLNNLAPEAAQKSVHVSKTLADMLAKAMEDNKPVRIEFDNGISVIIKISKDGKLSADFLPSTQVAEAYLRENLPLLKQRFEEQNLDYDELNQRERRNQDKEQNRKKGREDE